MQDRTSREVKWELVPGERTAWHATVAGERWTVEELSAGLGPRYTLLVNDVVVAEMDAWPKQWSFASAPGEAAASAVDPDAADRRELELEQQQLERTKGVGPSALVDNDDLV